jgi:hypothetical protein
MTRFWLTSTAAGLGLAAVLALGPAPARAQAPINPEQACTPDVMRLCSDFIPDRKEITACLVKNRRALSPDCRTVMAGPKKVTRSKKAKRKARRHRRR